MTKIYFARLEVPHAFASMAETMAENQTDLAANGRATREAQDRDERKPDHNRSSRFSIRTAASPGS